jgi:hypothetical protein
MTVAYVSRRCEDCDAFVRTAAGRLRLVYVEDAAEIPWYIESVPTIVVETRGEDGALAFDLYAGDDAFALIEPKKRQPAYGAQGALGQMGPSAQMGQMGQMGPTAPVQMGQGPHGYGAGGGPSSSGPSARDEGGALFECIDTEDGMSCGAFESLVPLGTEDDRRRTESTMAEWERAVAEERAHSQKKETSQLDRDFEKLKKERGN